MEKRNRVAKLDGDTGACRTTPTVSSDPDAQRHA